MTSWNSESLDIASALGLESAEGYHVEYAIQAADLFWCAPPCESSDFPCVAVDRTYAGCFGRYCDSRRCWAGRLVRSARFGTIERPSVRVKGSRCHVCGNVQRDERASEAHGEEFVECIAGHFESPVSVSCLVNRRVPVTVQVPCEDFWPAEAMPTEVAAWRLRRRRQARRDR